MAEWSNAPDSKSGIRLVRIEGSNPSLSAKVYRREFCHPAGWHFFTQLDVVVGSVIRHVQKYIVAIHSILFIAQTIFASKRKYSLMNINNDLFELLCKCYL